MIDDSEKFGHGVELQFKNGFYVARSFSKLSYAIKDFIDNGLTQGDLFDICNEISDNIDIIKRNVK
jgi:hypothetical protein